eukprot:PhF_6_TR17023/c0_g1_i1/m.25832
MSRKGGTSLETLKTKAEEDKLVNKFLTGHLLDEEDDIVHDSGGGNKARTQSIAGNNGDSADIRGDAFFPSVDYKPLIQETAAGVQTLKHQRSLTKPRTLPTDSEEEEEYLNNYDRLNEQLDRRGHDVVVDAHNSNLNMIEEVTKDALGEKNDLARLFDDFSVDDTAYKAVAQQLARFDIPLATDIDPSATVKVSNPISDAAEQEYVHMLHTKLDQARERISKLQQQLREANEKINTMSSERQNIVSLLDGKYEEVARLKVRNQNLEEQMRKLKFLSANDQFSPTELRQQLVALQEANQDMKTVNAMLLQENHMMKIRENRDVISKNNPSKDKAAHQAVLATDNTKRLVELYEQHMQSEKGFAMGYTSKALVLPTMASIMNSFVEKRKLREIIRLTEINAMESHDFDADWISAAMHVTSTSSSGRSGPASFNPQSTFQVLRRLSTISDGGHPSGFESTTPDHRGSRKASIRIPQKRDSVVECNLPTDQPLQKKSSLVMEQTPVMQSMISPSSFRGNPGHIPPISLQQQTVTLLPPPTVGKAWKALQDAVASHVTESRKEVNRKISQRMDSIRRLNNILSQQLEAVTADRDAKKEEALHFKEQNVILKKQLDSKIALGPVESAGVNLLLNEPVSIGIQVVPQMKVVGTQDNILVDSGFQMNSQKPYDAPRTEVDFLRRKVDGLVAKNQRLDVQLLEMRKRYVDLCHKMHIESQEALEKGSPLDAYTEADWNPPPLITTEHSPPRSPADKSKKVPRRSSSFSIEERRGSSKGASRRPTLTSQDGLNRVRKGSKQPDIPFPAREDQSDDDDLVVAKSQKSLLLEEKKIMTTLTQIVLAESRLRSSALASTKIEYLTSKLSKPRTSHFAYHNAPEHELYLLEHMHWVGLARVREERYVAQPSKEIVDGIQQCFIFIRALEEDLGSALKMPMFLSGSQNDEISDNITQKPPPSYVPYEVKESGETFASVANRFGLILPQDVQSAFNSSKGVVMSSPQVLSAPLLVPMRTPAALTESLAVMASLGVENYTILIRHKMELNETVSDVAEAFNVDVSVVASPHPGVVEFVMTNEDDAVKAFDVPNTAVIVKGIKPEVLAKLDSVQSDDIHVYNDELQPFSVLYLRAETSEDVVDYNALPGESLDTIARRTGTTVESVLQMNSEMFANNPDSIKITSVLVPVKDVKSVDPQVTSNTLVCVHETAITDTLQSVATKYNLDASTLADFNRIPASVDMNTTLHTAGVGTISVPLESPQALAVAAQHSGAIYKVHHLEPNQNVATISEAENVSKEDIRIHKAEINQSVVLKSHEIAIGKISTEPPIPIRVYAQFRLLHGDVDQIRLEQSLCDVVQRAVTLVHFSLNQRMCLACVSTPDMRTAESVVRMIQDRPLTDMLHEDVSITMRTVVVPAELHNHKIQEGDTITSLAVNYGVPSTELRFQNPELCGYGEDEELFVSYVIIPLMQPVSSPVRPSQPKRNRGFSQGKKSPLTPSLVVESKGGENPSRHLSVVSFAQQTNGTSPLQDTSHVEITVPPIAITSENMQTSMTDVIHTAETRSVQTSPQAMSKPTLTPQQESDRIPCMEEEYKVFVSVEPHLTFSDVVRKYRTSTVHLINNNPKLWETVTSVNIPSTKEAARTVLLAATTMTDDVRPVVLVDHHVTKNETLDSLAEKYSLHPSEIIEVNPGIESEFPQSNSAAVVKIPVGSVSQLDKLTISQDITIMHPVQSGDSLSSIAEKYNADKERIQVDVKMGENIVLSIPPLAIGSDPVETRESCVSPMAGRPLVHACIQTQEFQAVEPPPPQPVSVLPVGIYAEHKVGSSGQTLASLTKRLKTNVTNLISANPKILENAVVHVHVNPETAKQVVEQKGEDVVVVTRTLQEKDTIQSLADEFKVTAEEILAVNPALGQESNQESTQQQSNVVFIPITQPELIPKGQELLIQHIPKTGETLDFIAEKFETTTNNIEIQTADLVVDTVSLPISQETALQLVQEKSEETRVVMKAVAGTSTDTEVVLIPDTKALQTAMHVISQLPPQELFCEGGGGGGEDAVEPDPNVSSERRPTVASPVQPARRLLQVVTQAIDITATTEKTGLSKINLFAKPDVAEKECQVDFTAPTARKTSILSTLTFAVENSATQTDEAETETSVSLIQRMKTPPKLNDSGLTTYTTVNGAVIRRKSSNPLLPRLKSDDLSASAVEASIGESKKITVLQNRIELLQNALIEYQQTFQRQILDVRDSQVELKIYIRQALPELFKTLHDNFMSTLPFFRTPSGEKLFLDADGHDKVVLEGVKVVARSLSENIQNALASRRRAKSLTTEKEDSMDAFAWARHKLKDVGKYQDVLVPGGPKFNKSAAVDKSSVAGGKKVSVHDEKDGDGEDDDVTDAQARIAPLDLMRVVKGQEGQEEFQEMYGDLHNELMKIVKREMKASQNPTNNAQTEVNRLLDELSGTKLTSEQMKRLEEIRALDRDLRRQQLRKNFKIMEAKLKLQTLMKAVREMGDSIEKDHLEKMMSLWQMWLEKWNEERKTIVGKRQRQLLLLMQFLKEVSDQNGMDRSSSGLIPTRPKGIPGKIVKGATGLRAIEPPPK